jgi:hypothetical protein
MKLAIFLFTAAFVIAQDAAAPPPLELNAAEKQDTWKFEARIQYNKKDFKVAMPLPVKFAGDTPVISLTNFAVPGFGSFTARVVMYNGAYAGTWGSAGANGHGGKLFGKIVKNEPATEKPTDKPQP